MSKDPASQNWCFTINNPSEDDKNRVIDLIQGETCSIGIAEMEHTNGEGTPHIQGYIRFKSNRHRKTVSNYLPRANLSIAKGTWQQNFVYCSKENNLLSIKGDLTEARNNIKANLDRIFAAKNKVQFDVMYADMKVMSPSEFEQKYPKEWYKNSDKVLRIMIAHAMATAKTFNPEIPLSSKNYWIWGEPGVGKTRWASNLFPYSNQLRKNFNKWWDGFSLLNTKLVILDDYPCNPQGNVLVQYIKIWGDRYPFEGECKGSHVLVEPGRFLFVITSNYPINQCFINEEDQAAIHRRFREIEMTKDNAPLILATTIDTNILVK